MSAPVVKAKMPKQENSNSVSRNVKNTISNAASSHPTTAVMVIEAIKSLKERRGSSLHAIKKFISVSYRVDVVKLAVYIIKFINKAVENGTLIRTKGKGAAGSFKLGAVETTKVKKETKDNKAISKIATKETNSSVKKLTKLKNLLPKNTTSEKTVIAKPPNPKPKVTTANPKIKSQISKNGSEDDKTLKVRKEKVIQKRISLKKLTKLEKVQSKNATTIKQSTRITKSSKVEKVTINKKKPVARTNQ